MIILRIISFIVLFLSVVFLPWPVTLGLAAIAMAAFSRFWEAIIIGALLGALYGFSKDSNFLFAFFISSFVMAFLVEEYFKRLIQGKNIITYALIAFFGGSLMALFWVIFKIIIYYA